MLSSRPVTRRGFLSTRLWLACSSSWLAFTGSDTRALALSSSGIRSRPEAARWRSRSSSTAKGASPGGDVELPRSWFDDVLGKYSRVAIVGGPRTGKTTLSATVSDRPVIHTDDFKV